MLEAGESVMVPIVDDDKKSMLIMMPKKGIEVSKNWLWDKFANTVPNKDIE